MPMAAVLYLGDLARLRAFYVSGLGLDVADTGDGYCGLMAFRC